MPICASCSTSIEEARERCPRCGLPSNAPKDPLIGKVIGAYTLLRRLGAGGVGYVYEASGPSQANGSQRAAVKILWQNDPDKETIERFRREALAIQRLAHPNTAKIYDQGQTQGLLWLAMEYLEGQTLEEHLTQRSFLSVTETLAIMDPICQVLDQAHQQGIVHRDLTTANIMLSLGPGQPNAKLLDFGFAWLRGERTLTEADTVSGTAQYMSPEQWEGLKRADHRSDIYAVGVILYECLSGVLPVQGKTPLDWLRKHTFSKPTTLALLWKDGVANQSICAAVMRAISKSPDDRFQAIEALRRALHA